MKIKKVLLSAIATVCLTSGTWAQTVIPAYVPTNSLVGWWPFNGNANDLSINAYNGTVNGATLTADRFGNANKAYSFDGINNIITINNSASFNFNNGQALSFWIKINSFPTAFESIVFSQQISSSTSAVGFNISLSANGKLNYRYGNGNIASFGAVLSNSVSLNQWYHIICQYQSGLGEVYFNGQIFNTYTQQNAIIGTPNISLVIGDDTWGAGSNAPNYDGKLDDIGIWSRALTPCEVKKLYYSPAFTVAASNASICVGQSLTLYAGGVPNYSWSNGANTATTVVTPTASTVYTVSSTYTTGCADTKTIAVTVNACTGISELTKENTISIYPNPAKESITITSTNALAGKFYVIHDATGKQVAKGILSPEKTSVSLTGLSAGLYILSLEGKLNQTYKFVKE